MGNLNSEVQQDDNSQPLSSAYEPTSDRIVIPQAASATQDPQSGRWYGPLQIAASVTPPSVQRVNAQSGDFVAGSVVDLATQLTLLQGAITGNKMATKAGTSDIVDLATLLSLAGASGDASTVASFMGRLTKIRDLLAATLTVSGSVTTSGTVTEANSASILADLATLAGAISAGKMLSTETNSAAILADVATLSGAVTSSKMATKAANGDFATGSIADLSTLPASLTELLGDTDNLATLAGAISTGKMLTTETNSASIKTDLDTLSGAVSGGRVLTTPANNQSVNVAQALGATLSAANPLFVAQSQNNAVLSDTNPEINISNIQQMILNGKAYSCSTGLVSAAANQAAEWFADGTQAKNVLIWSVRVMYSNASQISQLQSITAKDATLTGAGVTHDIGNAINLKTGGAAPQSGITMDHNVAATPTGTALDEVLTPSTQVFEMLSPGMFLYVPATTASGIAVYTGTTAAGKWAVTVRWTEF